MPLTSARPPNANASAARSPGRSDGNASTPAIAGDERDQPRERVLAEAEPRPAVHERVVERVHQRQRPWRR